MTTAITRLFDIRYPVIQAGMIWTSGWRLASAVSNAGGLGLIGSGSMYPEILREHIRRCREATNNPFGVNIPLLYPDIDKHIDILIKEKVKIVFTSAGNPRTWTSILKEAGITVVHIVSSTNFAMKAELAGCDAVVAEGFEAGGHNGRDETTTLVLVPAVASAVKIPVIAAGGIATGRQMLAAIALGAQGVQVGTGFVATEEASCHRGFKEMIVNSGEGDTRLCMKKLVPVRLLKNNFFNDVYEAELRGASETELTDLLGRARAKKGMFEGDLDNGELEIGQASALVKQIRPAAEVVQTLMDEFNEALQNPLFKI